MISVRLPDGSLKEFPDDSSSLDVAQNIGPRLAQAVLAAKANGTIVDSTRPLKEVADVNQPVDLRLLTDRDPEALGVLRHSCAHVMARAVMRLFPGGEPGLRSDARQRLLLRLRLPAQAQRGGFRPDRRGDAEDRQGRRALRAIRPRPPGGPRVLRRTTPETQGRAHRHRAGRASDGQLLSARRVRRPVPRAAHPRRRPHQGVQAALGRRLVLEGECRQRAVAAALRHGLLQEGRAGGVSSASRRGQTPRPPRAGEEAGPLHDHQRRGPGALSRGCPRGRPSGRFWKSSSRRSF